MRVVSTVSVLTVSWRRRGRREHVCGLRYNTLHFRPWIQIANSSISVPWGVPWDAGFVILSIDLVKISLFAQPNYQFPFRTTLSHDGVRRRLQASSTLSDSRTTSHDIARHGTADRHAQLLSSSQTSRGSCTDPRYKARATSAKNHAQAHAARSRYPLAHPRPHPAFRKPSPPASARPDHHRSRSERLRAAQRRCRSTWSRRRLRGSCDAAERPTDLSFRSRPASSGRLPVSRRGGGSARSCGRAA